MSLLKRLFSDKSAAGAPPAPADDDEDSRVHGGPAARQVARRDVLHVVLRDTMRRHGIPSDWIESRTLSASPAHAGQGAGTYVTLIVKQEQERLLGFVPAFQSSFLAELERFDPRAGDWMKGLSWQFDFSETAAAATITPAAVAGVTGAATHPAAAVPEADHEQELQADLQALFAIRDAALAAPPEAPQAPQAPKP